MFKGFSSGGGAYAPLPKNYDPRHGLSDDEVALHSELQNKIVECDYRLAQLHAKGLDEKSSDEVRKISDRLADLTGEESALYGRREKYSNSLENSADKTMVNAFLSHKRDRFMDSRASARERGGGQTLQEAIDEGRSSRLQVGFQDKSSAAGPGPRDWFADAAAAASSVRSQAAHVMSNDVPKGLKKVCTTARDGANAAYMNVVTAVPSAAALIAKDGLLGEGSGNISRRLAEGVGNAKTAVVEESVDLIDRLFMGEGDKGCLARLEHESKIGAIKASVDSVVSTDLLAKPVTTVVGVPSTMTKGAARGTAKALVGEALRFTGLADGGSRTDGFSETISKAIGTDTGSLPLGDAVGAVAGGIVGKVAKYTKKLGSKAEDVQGDSTWCQKERGKRGVARKIGRG